MALPASDLDCPRCYPFEIESCLESVFLQLGLTANTTFTVMIEDQFGNTYDQDVISEDDGDIEIDTTMADFPEGLFATARNLSIVIVDQYLIVQTFTIDGIEYDSVCLEISNVIAVP